MICHKSPRRVSVEIRDLTNAPGMVLTWTFRLLTLWRLAGDEVAVGLAGGGEGVGLNIPPGLLVDQFSDLPVAQVRRERVVCQVGVQVLHPERREIFQFQVMG